ncbi:conserved hypothetical protein [Trichinella spiralis]|uniref:hypothetical protein n=1 Tax=Trichinella spiralis TaxID=6334 RepID=UPI0001EFD19A|nr:conserved hypothetical protein [Trichinella spiralis]
MLKTVLTYRGGCTGTNNGLLNVGQRSETPQAQVLCTSTSKILASGRVVLLLDFSLFFNLFMTDSNNASQRLLTIEHSAFRFFNAFIKGGIYLPLGTIKCHFTSNAVISACAVDAVIS